MPFSTIELVLRDMLSKAQNKHIRSLAQQKIRDLHRQFVVEGTKIASEWLRSSEYISLVVATREWLDANADLVKLHTEATVLEARESDMAMVSQLATAPPVLLTVRYPDHEDTSPVQGWCIALDGIQDPGNLGTIIRIADWFGISEVFCSADCVDAFNYKVVQAAMGSHLRVRIRKTNLETFLSSVEMPVYAAFLSGTSAYDQRGATPGVLLIGSEGRGISPALMSLPLTKITIPRIGEAESLNAAVSAGILCSWLVPR